MKLSLLASLTILVAGCASAPEEREWRPPMEGLKYSCEFQSVPEGASSFSVHVRVPEGLELSSGSGLVGNAPLVILGPVFLADVGEAQSSSMTTSTAEITWSNVVEAAGPHLELDIATRARPLELTLHLHPLAGTTVDVDSLRRELDGGLIARADGEPITATWTRLER